jgi:NADPH:quinone reductase-like Zn-dependent oxidoreductase
MADARHRRLTRLAREREDMKAIRSHEVGGPESLTLDEIDVPTPGKGEVLVAVKACAINFPDSLIIRDL